MQQPEKKQREVHPHYLTDAQLAERYGVSRSTIWRWSIKKILPRPVQLSAGTTRWKKEEIEKRDAERQAQSAA